MGNNTSTGGWVAMTKQEFINSEIAKWGEDYIFDLIDNGYEPVEMVVSGGSFGNGGIRWWWRNPLLTQRAACAIIPASRSVVSPVSTG
jgi:hypothetical protein